MAAIEDPLRVKALLRNAVPRGTVEPVIPVQTEIQILRSQRP